MALSELGTVLLDLPRGAKVCLCACGRHGESKKAFKDFFELWKDADQNLPVLIQAKKDYAAMR
jgi:hypothetical protein